MLSTMPWFYRLAPTVVLLVFVVRLAASVESSTQRAASSSAVLLTLKDVKGYGQLERTVARRNLLAHRSGRGQRSLLKDESREPEPDPKKSYTLSTSTHPDVGMDHLFVPLNRSCHPDCTKRGNCNAEEGRCECPFGYTGPSCSEPLLAGCQLGPLQEPFFGFMVPRSCECVRQANRFFGCSEQAETCTLFSFFFRNVKCYEFPGLPAPEQWSAMPALDAGGVEYFAGSARRGVELRPVAAMEGAVGEDLWGNHLLSLPLSRCGESRCHGRGACIVPLESTAGSDVREAASVPPHCVCYKGYLGHTCGDTLTELCPGGCRGRGRCLRGFCHCDPPYWGLDCSRERAWQPAPGAVLVPNRMRLRIYVYDLPANVAFPVALDDNIHDMNEPSYQTHRKFMELLLQDPSVRTENPHEANLFFVPATAYSYVSNTNPPGNQLASALSYVARTYPYFNASGGRDHFVWTTGDRGSCYVPQNLSHVLHVTLFGLHAELHDNGTTFLRPTPHHHPGYGCYHPQKDVLAAPWYDHMAGSKEAPRVYNELVAAKGEDEGRDLLFFFAGSVRPNDHSYSGGVRQALSAHLQALLQGAGAANYSDIMFIAGFTPDYEALYRRSRFCLAPHGAGFGVRLTLALTHACVPVIIQDQVYQPYESDGVLPYSRFSLRLGKADIPHLVPLLRAVAPQRLRDMRLAMAEYHRAFLWDPSLGGLAYNYTVTALERRLHGLWGRLWGRQQHPQQDKPGWHSA